MDENEDEILIEDPIFRKGILVSKINTLNNYLGNKKIMYDILSNDNRAFDFLPLTATFNVTDSDYKSIVKHAMGYSKKIKKWILKPALGLQGKDIIISDSPKKIIKYINDHGDYTDWVLSQYIDDPFLLKINGISTTGTVFKDFIGRKTHIRIYVLITKIDSILHIYLYKDNLIFSAAKEYSKTDNSRYSNLTNLHLGSIYYDKVLKIDGSRAYKDLSFPLEETVNEIFGSTFYSKKVFPQIKKMLEVILDNSKNYLNCDSGSNNDNRGCFQYIAIDIMPDTFFKLILLEINGRPGMNAPLYHWKSLHNFANGITNRTSGVINNDNNDNNTNGFILIK